SSSRCAFFFAASLSTVIYTLSLHDALPIYFDCNLACTYCCAQSSPRTPARRIPVDLVRAAVSEFVADGGTEIMVTGGEPFLHPEDRKSTRLNSSHEWISYAVFCLKKKKKTT